MRWSERPPVVCSRFSPLQSVRFDPHALSVAVAHLILVRPMKPLFADQVVSLSLDDAREIADGERVAITDPLLKYLLEFLGQDLAPHLRAGHVGTLKVHEYGSRMGEQWIDRHMGASLMLPVAWTTIQQTPGVRAVVHTSGKPTVFVTQEFLSHLQRVDAPDHEWELVI